jgi:hypothetical protein
VGSVGAWAYARYTSDIQPNKRRIKQNNKFVESGKRKNLGFPRLSGFAYKMNTEKRLFCAIFHTLK